MNAKEKEEYQKRAAYVVWTLKKWLPKSIADDEKFRQSVHKDSDPKYMHNENNLTAVAIMTKKSILKRIEDLEKEYDKGDTFTS